jgi:hypothetical protein
MRSSTLKAAVGLAFITSLSSASQLQHWPTEAAITLNNMIAQNANQSNYAVFDMDNTSYHYDLEDSLLAFLENRGILTRENIDPSLKLIDFKDTAGFVETLYSYYGRLCEIDELICYPWVAQVWSGFTLRKLKGYVDELMAHNSSIPTRYWTGDEVASRSVNRPKIFQGQVELYNALMDHGISVYVISAAHEELVRMVASDPKYGYNVPPQHVIGVSTTLKNATSGALTNTRKQIAEGTYNETANLDLVVTAYLWTPATWFAGKWAAVLTYLNQWRRPILVAGDTPGSDSYMLFHGVDVAKGGVRLWIRRRDAYFERLLEEIRNNTQAQIANGREVTADRNWVVVFPDQIL